MEKFIRIWVIKRIGKISIPINPYYHSIIRMEYLYLPGNFASLTTQQSIDEAYDVLKNVAPKYKKIFWVPGPKEYYCSNKQVTMDFVYKIMKGFCSKIPNLVVLRNEYFIHSGTVFFGTTLWEPVPQNEGCFPHIYRLPQVCIDSTWVTRSFAEAISSMVEAMLIAKSHHYPLEIITTFSSPYSTISGTGWVFD